MHSFSFRMRKEFKLRRQPRCVRYVRGMTNTFLLSNGFKLYNFLHKTSARKEINKIVPSKKGGFRPDVYITITHHISGAHHFIPTIRTPEPHI